MIFKQTKELIREIDIFLDAVSESGLLFELALKDFLYQEPEQFKQRLSTLIGIERSADINKRKTENDLYAKSLIPEHRGDVLRIIEQTDNIIDTIKEVLINLDIEKPLIPEMHNKLYAELGELGSKSVESVVSSVRMSFTNPAAVKEHLHKVYFYEKEADKISDTLKRNIFNDVSLDLSHKMHLRYFAARIGLITDRAQETADMLAIFMIKQSI